MAALLGVGAVGGLLNGLAIAAIGIPPILATLGTGLIFTGIAVVLSGGAAVLGFPDAISVLGNGALFGVPAPVLLFAALAAAVAFVLNWTGFGCASICFGTNPLAARFAGIDNFRVTLGAYLISGLLVVARRTGHRGARELREGRLRLILPAAVDSDRRARRESTPTAVSARSAALCSRSCRCSSCRAD